MYAARDERQADDRASLRGASNLREDLLTAGCRRDALHVEKSDPMRARMKFHNLRDTCLTHMAVRRDPPQDVQWRMGHTAAVMSEAYIASARYEAGPSFGEPLAPIPNLLIHPDTDEPKVVITRVIVPGKGAETPVKQWRRRESKSSESDLPMW